MKQPRTTCRFRPRVENAKSEVRPNVSKTGSDSSANPLPARPHFVPTVAEPIKLNGECLGDYLVRAGLTAPLVIRALLQEQDWSEFEVRYQKRGRPAYAPWAMMGLILYGMMCGVSSLRSLERLGRSDLGALWVSGGICPDHANIGRFIVQHEASLSEGFFKQLTGAVLEKTGSDVTSLAGDGTVLEAACSHYKRLNERNITEHVAKAQQAIAQAPDDRHKQAQAERAQQAQQQLEARVKAARSKGKPSARVCLGATDPEAAVQPGKRGRGSHASYKPFILANKQRVIVGTYVDASSETVGLACALTQSEQLGDEACQKLLLDAGFCTHQVIELALAREINLLCPEGNQLGEGKTHQVIYAKSQFQYDGLTQTYTCPSGETLEPISHYKGSPSEPSYVVYASNVCQGCVQRSACTRSTTGRKVKRYSHDEAKEALREVMSHPQAQRHYRQRQAWVEPVFSVLRGLQGLNRFRRRGKAGVRREWMLHVLAYNLSRVVAVSKAAKATLFRRFLALAVPLDDEYGKRQVFLAQVTVG